MVLCHTRVTENEVGRATLWATRCHTHAMASEIELKLLLPGADPATVAQVLAQSPALVGCPSAQQWLSNRYYDTPDFTLREQRAALRLRQVSQVPWASSSTRQRRGATSAHPSGASDVWWQTFKTAGVSHGGLSQRGEWECAVPRGELDATALQTTPWAALDPHGHLFQQLQPCFETRCHRTTWQVKSGENGMIEVALDVGEIVAAGRTLPMLELELELLSGSAPSLFELAQSLGQHVAVLPCDVSKAERGYALAQGLANAPVRARPTRLRVDTLPTQAAQQVLGEMFDQLTRNLAGLSLADDPELVHQARVAWRRWRSAGRLFRPWLPPMPDRHALRPLLDALGPLRDLDVARTDTLPRWAPAFVQGNVQRQTQVDAATTLLTQAAQARRNEVRQALHTPATGLAWLAHTEWLHRLSLLANQGNPSPHHTARHWARQRMNKLHRRLEATLEAAAAPSADAQLSHTARLLAKRTRYSVEALTGLLPPTKAKRWNQEASHLQQQLGAQRDILQAVVLLQSVHAAPEWVAFLQGVAAAKPATAD